MAKSKYKGVYKHTKAFAWSNGYWKASYYSGEYRWSKLCKTEREAAIAYDKKLIKLGLEPVNILVRK